APRRTGAIPGPGMIGDRPARGPSGSRAAGLEKLSARILEGRERLEYTLDGQGRFGTEDSNSVSAREAGGIMNLSLNRRGHWVVEALLAHAEERRVAVHPIEGGGRFIDCGIEARGGLLAGIELARVCLGDLATVCLVPGELGGRSIPLVQVVTDHPV